MSNEYPPNWVKLRAECNLDVCFDSLRGVVNRDVKEMNALPAEIRSDFLYKVQDGDNVLPSFSVVQECEKAAYENSQPHILFSKSPISIEVSRKPRGAHVKTALFTITPEWSEKESRCRLLVNGKELKAWEISRLALEPMFFEPNV